MIRQLVEKRMEAGPSGMRFDRQMRNAFFDLGYMPFLCNKNIDAVRLYEEKETGIFRVMVELVLKDVRTEESERRAIATTAFNDYEEAEALVEIMDQPDARFRADRVMKRTDEIIERELTWGAIVGVATAAATIENLTS